MLIPFAGIAQGKGQMAWAGPSSDTIPFELVRGSIILKLSISGKPYRFIFDTGAPLSISEKVHFTNKFPLMGRKIVGDATGYIDSLNNVFIPEFSIGKLSVANSQAVVMNYQESSFFSCLDIDGLIGGNVFKDCIVEIDLKKQRLIISPAPNAQTQNSNSNNVIPVSFDEQFNPRFDLVLGREFTLAVLFDTGSEDLLTISAEAYEQSSHYCRYTQLRRGKYSIASAHNIPVADNYSIVLLDSLRICGTTLKTPEICVAENADVSILGTEILQYGIVRLDYLAARISFTPYTNELVFIKNDNFPGFSVGRENTIYVVNGLESGSPAAIGGLDMGMQITRIANIDMTSASADKDCRILKKNLPGMKSITVDYIDHHRRKKTVTLKRNRVIRHN